MKWTVRILITLCVSIIFGLTLAPRASAAAPVAYNDASGIFVSIFSECEVPHADSCEIGSEANTWDVVATAHDAVFITFRGYTWDGVTQILSNNGWSVNPHVQIFYHDVYQATVSTDASDPVTRYHPDDQTAISLALSVASDLRSSQYSVDVQYLR